MAFVSRMVGMVLVTFFVVWVTLCTGMFYVWWSFETIVAMVVMMCGGMMMSFGTRLPLQALGATIRGERIDDVATFAQYLNVFNRAHQLAWASGLLLMIVGHIAMMYSMCDPSRIGAGVAIGSLPIMYAALLAEFIISPMKHALVSRNKEVFEQSRARVDGSVAMTVGFVAASLSMLAMLFMVTLFAFDEAPDERLMEAVHEIREAFEYRADRPEIVE